MSRQRIIPILLILFFLFFSLWPTFYEWNSRGRIKPERHFELVHNFPTDYNLYLSKIRQGKEGAWLATEKYTSESHAGSLSQILYIMLGRAWDWAHGQTPYVWLAYHAARVLFAALFLFILWKITEWIFPTFPWQVTSWLLVVTASTWPKFETVNGLPRFGGYMPWWSVIDSLQRITFIPHVVFGQALLIFILWVIAGGFIKRDYPGNWIFLGIVGFILGIIFPPALLFVYGVIAVLTIGEIGGKLERAGKTAHDRWNTWVREVVTGRVVFVVLSLTTFVYYATLFTQYPWKRLVEFDVLHPTKFSFLEYFLALGPTFPLGLLGIVVALIHRDTVSTKLRVFITWVAAWLVFIFVFSKIPQQSPTRFTEMVPHIPLGILTAYLFYWLRHSETVRGSFKKIQSLFSFGIWHMALVIPSVVIALGLGSMFSSWLWQRDFVDHKLRSDLPLVPKGAEVMYPLENLFQAMNWLQVYTPRSSVVLSGQSTGNLIPVYSGNTVYVGHANTVGLEKKLLTVEQFYRGQMSNDQALSWVRKAGISYIVYGPEEMEMVGYTAKDLRAFYPNLTTIYENARVRLYRVP